MLGPGTPQAQAQAQAQGQNQAGNEEPMGPLAPASKPPAVRNPTQDPAAVKPSAAPGAQHDGSFRVPPGHVVVPTTTASGERVMVPVPSAMLQQQQQQHE